MSIPCHARPRRVLAILPLLLLGCAHERPEPASTAMAQPVVSADADAPASQPAAPTGPLTLRQACDLAEQRHPAGVSAAASEAIARGEARQAGAHPNPQIGVGGGRARSRVGEGSSTIGEIGLSQPIEYPGKRGARIEAASAGLLVARTEREIAILELRLSVRKSYIDALRARADSDLAALSAKTANDLLTAMDARTRVGEVAGAERARALLEQQRSQSSAAVAQSERDATLATLASWLGIPVESLELASRLEQVPAVERATVDSAIANHPRLRRLQAEATSLRAQARAAELAWRPDVEAGVFAAREADSDHLGARLSVELPLWNRNQGGIVAAQARVARIEAELAVAKRAVSADVETAWSRFQRARVQAELYGTTLATQSAALLDLGQRAYAAGETSLLELLEARRAALEVEDARIRAYAEASSAINDLIAATGSEGILP